ncbi:hypothetical protein MED222_08883 [Vibrio sp. MED222]|nr:hypothetical protein MED222_08883 [Vibrio sp. MED222]
MHRKKIVSQEQEIQEQQEKLSQLADDNSKAKANTSRIKGEFKQKVEKDSIKNALLKGNKGQSLGDYSSKAFATPDAGDVIEATISRELSELAIKNQIVLQKVRSGVLPDGSAYTLPKIKNRPNILEALENVNADVINFTDTQSYVETSANFSKSMSFPSFTHEALLDSVRDVEGDCLRLISEERGFHFISQLLFGDGTDNNLRGLLTSRIDSANTYTEALKEDDLRDQEFLKVIKTGVAGELGSDETAILDLLVDVQQDINFEYQQNAVWYVSKKVLKTLRKMKVSTDGTDQRPLITMDFGSFDGSGNTEMMLLGKPVIVVDQLDELVGTGNEVAMFYGDLEKTIEFGLITGSEHLIVDEVTAKGVRGLYADVRFFSMLHENDAVRVVVAAV